MSGYPGALFQGFHTHDEAVKWLDEQSEMYAQRSAVQETRPNQEPLPPMMMQSSEPDMQTESQRLSQISSSSSSGLKIALDEFSIAELTQRNKSDTLQVMF